MSTRHHVVAMEVWSADIASDVICAVVICGDANNMEPEGVVSSPVPSAAPCNPCPAICELYSAVSILRMYGIMLSIWTLPIRPAKNSSSMTLGLREWSAGRRRRSLASRSGLEGCVWRTWLASSLWARSCTLSICWALGRDGVSVKKIISISHFGIYLVESFKDNVPLCKRINVALIFFNTSFANYQPMKKYQNTLIY